jgi:signal transduction histidine kinase
LLYLAQTAESHGRAKEFLSLAESELGRVATITKQTLGFFRDGAKPRNVPMREVVRSVLHMLKQQIAGKQLVVSTEFANDAVIYGMEGELRQVAANLCANAIDASAMGGSLRIQLRNRRGLIKLIISDEGNGIESCVRQRLFTPFFTTKGSQGTGLGLWVSKQIVEKHGGTIRFRSTPGRGTMFVVSLPANRERGRAVA